MDLTAPNYSGLGSAKAIFGSSFARSSALPGGYQTAVLWFIGVTALGTWILTRTTFGNWIFAPGGDPVAARNTGVPVNRTKILLFLGTSPCSRPGGHYLADGGLVGGVGAGRGYEFYYIIAAVVGGCLLSGGYGSALGPALGACIIGMAFEGVIYANLDSSWDFTFLGIVLFIAVVVNRVFYQRALKARR